MELLLIHFVYAILTGVLIIAKKIVTIKTTILFVISTIASALLFIPTYLVFGRFRHFFLSVGMSGKLYELLIFVLTPFILAALQYILLFLIARFFHINYKKKDVYLILLCAGSCGPFLAIDFVFTRAYA